MTNTKNLILMSEFKYAMEKGKVPLSYRKLFLGLAKFSEYEKLINGFNFELTKDQIERIKAVKTIIDVLENSNYNGEMLEFKIPSVDKTIHDIVLEDGKEGLNKAAAILNFING